MKSFTFDLNEPVKLVGSTESGKVIARAEYTNKGNQYLVRYRAADGRLVESWWDEDALASERPVRSAA